MNVTVVLASPRPCEQRALDLPAGATVDDAVGASGFALEGIAGVAVFGERVCGDRVLREGERVELLGALIADPKSARRDRARQGRRV